MDVNLIREYIIKLNEDEFANIMFLKNYYQRFLICQSSCKSAMKHENSTCFAEGNVGGVIILVALGIIHGN
ncbi:hypothetical protein COBT_002718 [Conglomerata obtusa]